MRRKAEWHHHLVAAVDTGLTAALTRRLIWFILPPAERGPAFDPPALHSPPVTAKMQTGASNKHN
jgi:hypothetical protein